MVMTYLVKRLACSVCSILKTVSENTKYSVTVLMAHLELNSGCNFFVVVVCFFFDDTFEKQDQ